MRSVFLDTSVLIRYFAEDDVPRAAAAAEIIDSSNRLAVSTGVVVEALHVLRTDFHFDNPGLAALLIQFLSRANVELVDADKAGVLRAIATTQGSSARRIPDAIIATAAAQASVDYIATFDETLRTPLVQVRML
jgi:predicted nucleic acid-binding protein